MIEQTFRDSPNRTARQAWLEARRGLIGASDSPAILGVGYSGSGQWSVWHEKVFGREESEAPLSWVIGQEVQDTIGRLYQFTTGNPFIPERSTTLRRRDATPFIGCSLDGFALLENGERVPLELKNVGEHASDEWRDGQSPLKYVVQLQHQMLVCESSRGVLCALIGGNRIEHRVVERDNAFLDVLVRELTAFWELVERQTPPPIDASEAAREAIHRMYPRAAKGTCVALPQDAVDWVAALEQARQDEEMAVAKRRLIESRLKMEIGEAEYGAVGDGKYVKWERSEIAEGTFTLAAHVRHVVKVVSKLPTGVAYVDQVARGDRERIASARADNGGVARIGTADAG